MTKERAIHKIEFSIKAYQNLIDQNVSEGEVLGDGVQGKWQSDKAPIQEYQEMIDALTMAKEALEQEPRWIPVSERLPEENKTLIASTEYEVCPETRYTKEDGWEWAYESGAGYWEKLAGVKAWMPLPELYKAESEDKE
ncbi:MAG: DUF551 domain-containing protein [Clostridiales bacterium]|nr:DUF551 domain-containing protein [Clostridiales bacterium]